MVTTVFYIIHAVALYFAAESPRWLIDKEKHEKGHKMIKKLRKGASHQSIKDEFDATHAISMEEAAIKRVPFLDFFKSRHLWWPLIISVNLHFCQQLTGISAVNYYANTIMVEAGVEKDMAEVANLGVSVLEVAVTVLSAFLVDKVGRRPLMLVGLTGQLLSHILFTIFFATGVSKGIIACLAIFLFAFSLGPGPIPWFMVAELFNQAARPMALSIGLLTNWICNLAVGLAFPHALVKKHLFLFFSFFNFVIFTPDLSR